MAEENQHIQKLIEAREHHVKARRDIARTLAEPYKRGHPEMRDAFKDLQSAIEAIDRAIADERRLVSGT